MAAAELWEVLERMSDAASEAYRDAVAARADRDREHRAALLDALLDNGGTAAEAAEAAARLGLPERGRFAVIASGPGGSPPGPVPAPAAAGAPRVWWRVRAGGASGLVELGHHPLEAVRELLAPPGARAGVSPVVVSPAELAYARRLAELALHTAPAAGGPGATLLDERLPAALVASDAELAGRLRKVVLGPVLELPPEDRRVLLTTLGTWLACGGSTTYAAQRLYCHRNTVSNRLRRLERLTGRSLSDPAQVVELALAHAAVLQHAAELNYPAGSPAPPVSPACADSRRYGTSITATPGVNSSLALSRSAFWLCSGCSHQWPTTYSGMTTDSTSPPSVAASSWMWAIIGPTTSR